MKSLIEIGFAARPGKDMGTTRADPHTELYGGGHWRWRQLAALRPGGAALHSVRVPDSTHITTKIEMECAGESSC